MLRTAATLLLAVLALAACDQAQDAAKDKAADSVQSAVKDQICTLVQDGNVSKADVAALDRVIDRAHDLGLPDSFLDPVHEIVTNGAASADDLADLKAACA